MTVPYFLKILFILFIFRETGREGERERNINVWLPLALPTLGTQLATQACAWLGIEPETLCFVVWCSVHWATPAKAVPYFLSIPVMKRVKIFYPNYLLLQLMLQWKLLFIYCPGLAAQSAECCPGSHGCGLGSWWGHTEESTNQCISKWNNKIDLSLFLPSLSLKSTNVKSIVHLLKSITARHCFAEITKFPSQKFGPNL